MDSPLPSVFTLGLLILTTLTIGKSGLATYDTLTTSWAAAEALSEARIASDVTVTSISSDGFDWDVTLRNDGDTPVVDFSQMDLIAQYVSGTGAVSRWLPFSSALQPNSWTIIAIQDDAFETGVFNQGETMQLEVCLDPPVEDTTNNWLQVTTDLGISASRGFAGVTPLGGCAACVTGDTGFVSPSQQQATSGGSGGNGFESNPTAAFADGGAFASNVRGPGDRHLYYAYGLAISSLCDVVGIEVRLDWWVSLTPPDDSMSVELSWNGGATWTAAKTDPNETTTEHTAVLGGAADTWGHAWTPQELTDANFRVRVTSGCSGVTCAIQDSFLDWVPVKVYVQPR